MLEELQSAEARGAAPWVLAGLVALGVALGPACSGSSGSAGPAGAPDSAGLQADLGADAEGGTAAGYAGAGDATIGDGGADRGDAAEPGDSASAAGDLAADGDGAASSGDGGEALDCGGATDGGCALGPDAQADGGGPDGGARLVVVTLNTHSFQEGESSLDKLRQIGVGLAQMGADLVGLNEVMSGTFWAYDYNGARHDGAELIRDALERASGVQWHMHRRGFAHWADGEEMSNVLLSRFPIVQSGDASLTTTDFWPGPAEQRSVIYGRVEVPDLGPVNVFVTHTAGFDSADTVQQIDEVKGFMATRFRGNEALDLLLGDLNTPSTWPAYTEWLHRPPFTLIDTYHATNPDGFADATQVQGEHRIDYILAGGTPALARDVANMSSALVFDGRASEGSALPVVSDHKGVITVFHYGR